MKKLTGEQTKILYLPDEKNLVILGAAGSGKSLVALYKSVQNKLVIWQIY